MDRRKSLKLIATGAVATPIAIAGCNTENKNKIDAAEPKFNLDRSKEELERESNYLTRENFLPIMKWQQLLSLLILLFQKMM